MSSKYHLFAILLVNVLAAVINTSARSTAEEGLVKHTDLRDDHGRDVYLWRISENEQERLSALLEQDFYDLEVDGTYLNSPPQTCSHCGKETEFADWVYTALKRGIHSPEFIAESLKLGNIPKGRLHDVYCSRCGHLTAFRNPTGEEGGAYHVSHATPYDRTTRTFGRFNWKREVDDETTEEATTAAIQPEANPGVDHTDGWPAGFNWIYKREESAVEDTEPAHTDGWPAGFNWVYKREESAVEDTEPAHTDGWPAGFNWVYKREESAVEDTEPAHTDGWPAGFNWVYKREESAVEDTEPAHTNGWPAGGSFNWIYKREESSVEDTEPIHTDGWATGSSFNWIYKREESAVEDPEPVHTNGWATGSSFNWIYKREEPTVNAV